MPGIRSQKGRLSLFIVLASLLLLPAGAMAQGGGIAAKQPVLGGSCKNCSWGVLAEFVKQAMAPAGYNVAICYSCSGPDSIRIVADHKPAPEITPRQQEEGTTVRPSGPVDFGINRAVRIAAAFRGDGDFAKDGPRKNLRIIARIEEPSYALIALRRGAGFANLAQIRDGKKPVRIMINGNETTQAILDYYGLTKANVESWGGKIISGTDAVKPKDFDLLIGVGGLSNSPENNMWYEASWAQDLVFVPLPQDLREKLVAQFHGTLVNVPFGYLHGQMDPVATVGFSGQAIFGNADMPEQFAYDVAKALDEHHGLLQQTGLPLSYDSMTVGENDGVPLHPGAIRYYRQRGYMK